MVLGFSNSLATGATRSSTEDSKALIVCRERKHFVRQILDGRCALAEAHEAYIHSLKGTGLAIRKLVAVEQPAESSLCTSTSAISEPITSTDNYSERFHVAHMKSSGSVSQIVEEKPPVVLTVNMLTSSGGSPKPDASENKEWDYFSIFHPMHNRLPVEDISKSEDDLPELEEEKEPATSLTDGSFSPEEVDTLSKKTEDEAEERPCKEVHDEVQPLASSTANEVKKENLPETKAEAKDILMSVKDIELLFIRASESGAEVPRLLEANIFNYNLTSSDGTAMTSKTPTFLSALLFCCRSELPATQDPQDTQLKLDWHKSSSSLSSSSRSPMIAPRENGLEPASTVLNSCMNSGSHASTLDRLYAWERKLYDEVKANGFICRKYDAKCKLLKSQDLKGEKPIIVDKTRAGVKDLHSRICVAIHRIDSISRIIEEIRDKELQPQLEELISAFSRMWKTMVDCHRLQHEIIKKALCGSAARQKPAPQAEYLRMAAAALQAELNGMNTSFSKWIIAHRLYLQAINNWVLKCVKRVGQQRGRKKDNVFPPRRATGPPIYVTCGKWLTELDTLPMKETSESMKRLATETSRIIPWDERKRKKKNDVTVNGEVVGGEVIDWGSCLVTVQRGLVDLLGKLEVFAEKSEGMYRRLGSEVLMVRRKYEVQKAAADQRNS
ncbi:uncharacterized protein LOC144708480 [Wolffia australiana]